MKTNRFGLHDLLYYGEVVGVLLAWVVGVVVVLSASATDQPESEPQQLATATAVELES